MNLGMLLLWGLVAGLGIYALMRRDGSFNASVGRAIEQFFKLVPRLFCALAAAGFIAELIPSELISTYLGADAGILGIFIGTAVGAFIPAGPVIAFSIAAVFAKAGASTPSLIAFISSWTLFAAHRIFIYEIPLLGVSFLRLRVASVFITPILAGLLAMGLIAVAATAGN